MSKRYYNTWEFQQALSSLVDNPYESKIKFELYLKKYPKDYSAYPYYISILITLGELDKAEKILNYLEEQVSKEKYFASQSNRTKIIKNKILYNRIKLLSYQSKYEELYQLYLDNYYQVESMDLNHIIFYCRKQIGKITDIERDRNSYLFRQIIDYQESEFLEHIQKHLADYNCDNDNPNKNIFVPSFPLEEVLKEVRKYIPSDKRICYGFYENTYVFKYDSCGRDNNKTVNYFKVICFHNTSDIITMLPTIEGENLPYIDLNYLIQEPLPHKVKRMSRIDKFNQRYKLN